MSPMRASRPPGNLCRIAASLSARITVVLAPIATIRLLPLKCRLLLLKKRRVGAARQSRRWNVERSTLHAGLAEFVLHRRDARPPGGQCPPYLVAEPDRDRRCPPFRWTAPTLHSHRGRGPPYQNARNAVRWSQSLIPTMKESPDGAEIPSHVLMLRAGLVGIRL